MLLAGAALAGDVYLGITMDELTPSMARALGLDDDQGILINQVVEGSPAEEAGLEAGDVLLMVGSIEITGIAKLQRALNAFDPGDEVELTVQRDGKRKSLDVTLGEREKRSFTVTSDGDRKIWSWFDQEKDEDGNTVFRWKDGDGEREVVVGGLSDFNFERGFLGIVPGSADQEDLKELGVMDGRGVLVERVLDDGPSKEAGLQDGDVIVAIDNQPIESGKALSKFMQETEPDQTVTVRVIRDRQTREVEVELAGSAIGMDIGENLRMFMPRDPHDPKAPRFYELHSGRLPGVVDSEELEREREELEKMRSELAELREELQKLREELKKDE
jgi:serine protease Do